MARTAHWFTLGLATLTFAALTGCSNPRSSAPSQPSAQQSSQQSEDSSNTASKSEDAKTDARVVNDVKIPPGTDPLAMVFSTRQPNAEPTGSEQIRVTYPAADKATVVVTKTGLKDDSVAAIRTRYEFKPSDASAAGAKQWQLVQVTQQNKCQKGRGSQDWAGATCQ